MFNEPYPVRTLECSTPGCDETLKDHAWGHIKASNNGWVFLKNDAQYCPTHKPEWYDAWKLKKEKL